MAWDFDGTNDYMECDLGANYAPPLTMAAWINVDGFANRNILSLSVGAAGSGTAGANAMRINSLGNVAAFSDTAAATGNSSAISATTAGTGTWVHAAARFASNSSRIAYLDGAAGTENTTTRDAGNTDIVLLGTGTGSANLPTVYFNGRIAEAAIWTAALDASEIAALAKGYRTSLIRPDKLLWYAPLIREVQDVRGGKSITNNVTAAAVHPRRIA